MGYNIALLWYDYGLTFPEEVRYMWRSKEWKVSTFLYIFCRYALPANLLYLLAIANKLGSRVRYSAYLSQDHRTRSSQSLPMHSTFLSFCDDFRLNNQTILLLSTAVIHGTKLSVLSVSSAELRSSASALAIVHLPDAELEFAAVFAMRTYAVCAQSKLVLYGLGAIGLTCVVLDCVSGFAVSDPSATTHIKPLLSQLHVPGLRCHGSSSIQMYVLSSLCNIRPSDLRLLAVWIVPRSIDISLVTILSSLITTANTLLSILVCVFESIATALTVFRSVQALRAQGQSRNKKNTFHYLVLEQGVLYFG